MPKTIVISTGATVTFRALLTQVINRQFLDFLVTIGVSKLVVQYGNEIVNGVHLSKQFVSELLSHLDIAYNDVIKYDTLSVDLIPFSQDISKVLSPADLVISHGGTGSIIDALRLNKKLIVVPNDTLMNNHQLEISVAFESRNLVKSCLPKQLNGQVGHSLIQSLLDDTTKLSSLGPPTVIVESIIAEELS
jgi:beta-1,4-N-acetylglucosaminyltransferase